MTTHYCPFSNFLPFIFNKRTYVDLHSCVRKTHTLILKNTYTHALHDTKQLTGRFQGTINLPAMPRQASCSINLISATHLRLWQPRGLPERQWPEVQRWQPWRRSLMTTGEHHLSGFSKQRNGESRMLTITTMR